MTDRTRFIIGGIGGLMPVLIFLVNGNLSRYFSNTFIFLAVGLFLRPIILFLIGGFTASLYNEVRQKFKVFQIGIGAPAMVAGLLTASANSPILSPMQSSMWLSVCPVVHAQTLESSSAVVKRFTLPQPNPLSQVVQGVTGYQPSNIWFVLAGSFPELGDARSYAAQINARSPTTLIHAEVYAPYSDPSTHDVITPYYSVVIGAQMTQEDAKRLVELANERGLGSNVYFRTFPNLPFPSNDK